MAQAERNLKMKSAGLERESDRSLYEQIIDRLRLQVQTQMRSGDKLPTEAELVNRYSVSRSTVRKAAQQLVDEGVLTRKQGKGTFVARPIPSIVHSIDRLAPFMDTFKNVGEDLETRVISFEWIADPKLPKILVGWDKPILCYQRLYVSRGIPHAVTQVNLPAHLARRLTLADIESHPVYDVLSLKLKVKPARAEFLVSCRPPSPSLSQKLEVSQSSLLLVLERISFDHNDLPIEHTTHFLRPDVYQLSVVLNGLQQSNK
jgi:GntR family transcriptional regulator